MATPLARVWQTAHGAVFITALISVQTFARAQEKGEMRERMKEAPPSAPGGPPGGPPMPGAQPGAPDPNAKPGEAPKPEEKKAPEAVKRPTTPKTPPDPKELTVRPEADGKLSFSFKGQPWPDVLEWLADVSDLSLHWVEAPPGYVDLTTRGRYTVNEVRDLINSVLLSSGYTLLKQGEILVVANVKTLDVSLVPRVRMEDLDARGTYELVKVVVQLDWLVAETAAEEIKSTLSPYGKVTALKATNRLDLLDTAGNLRRVRELLGEEQADGGQKQLIRVFKLDFVKARDVVETLNTLLGIEAKNKGPMTPEQMQMQQQQAMMQMQMQQAQGGQGGGPRKEPPVYLAVNQRENSILANAPPDKMALIAEAVTALDIPQENSASLLNNLPRMQVYRLSGINPDTLVKVLNDLGGLDPMTRLEVDSKNKSIIAYAPLADHLTIQSVVDKLDGSGRRFEVVQLRRLSAEYVAGSIEVLMKPPKEENNNNRRRYYYYDYDYFGGGNQEQSEDKFHVEADVENNRLLLRANEVELAEIRGLLEKLGESPAESHVARTSRFVPADSEEASRDLIERLRKVWPQMGDNPIDVEVMDGAEKPAPSPVEEKSRKKAPAPKPKNEAAPTGDGEKPNPKTDKAASSRTERPRTIGEDAFLQAVAIRDVPASPTAADGETPDANVETPDANDADARVDSTERVPVERAVGPAPVRIVVGPDGIAFYSSDTEALDRLEEMAARLTRSRANYTVFRLKHTFAKDVVDLLEDIYKDAVKSTSAASALFDNYWGYGSSQNQQTKSSLAKRKPLSFVADPVTNTILVSGADATQLQEIERLIELYDKTEPPDSNAVRHVQHVKLRYAKAADVSDAIKEVFRDLLSPNDKAIVGANPQPQQQQGERNGNGGFYSAMYSYLTENEKDSEMVPRFKGMLSIGVDARGNTLIVSAPKALLDKVLEMVDQLEEASRPARPSMRILKVRAPEAARQLQSIFGDGKGDTNGKPATPKPSGNEGAPAGQQPNQPNGGDQNRPAG